MAERLEQAQHAIGARRGAHQHRAHEPVAQLASEIVEYFVARRLDVLEQLLHQLVVVIGQRFQHGKSRRLFQIGGVAFERHHLRGSVFLVNKCTLQRQIDEPTDDLAGERRDLPQNELGARGRLQQIEHIADAGMGFVDLVDEQNAGNFPVFQFAQDQLQLRDFFLVHFADHHGGVDRRQYRAHVLNEFHRTGTVKEGVIVAHEVGGGDRQLDAHPMMARLFARVADGVAGLDGALARNRAGACEYRFEQGRLAALERTDQRDAARTHRARAITAICRHQNLPRRLPQADRSSARTAGSYCLKNRLSFQCWRGWVKRRDGARRNRGPEPNGGRPIPRSRKIARTRRARMQAEFRLSGAGMPAPRMITPSYCAKCSSSAPTPAATFSPTWPWTESGCSATERFDPPTNTLAPRPAASVASAVAPA